MSEDSYSEGSDSDEKKIVDNLDCQDDCSDHEKETKDANETETDPDEGEFESLGKKPFAKIEEYKGEWSVKELDDNRILLIHNTGRQFNLPIENTLHAAHLLSTERSRQLCTHDSAIAREDAGSLRE
jgi:hypothetical protein